MHMLSSALVVDMYMRVDPSVLRPTGTIQYAFPNIYKVRLSVMTRTIHPTPATSVNYLSAGLLAYTTE